MSNFKPTHVIQDGPDRVEVEVVEYVDRDYPRFNQKLAFTRRDREYHLTCTYVIKRDGWYQAGRIWARPLDVRVLEVLG